MSETRDPDSSQELLSTRPSTLRRDADLLGRRDSGCRKWLQKKIDAIVRGFEEQATRSDALDKWWRIYNCELDDNQFYNGTAQVYVPIIHDAVKARATRGANQLCPETGRWISATSTDGHLPNEVMALVNYYFTAASIKSDIVYPLLINGDIEGQYNLCVDWDVIARHIVSRETRQPEVSGIGVPGGMMGESEIIDIIEEEIKEGRPAFEVLHDSDVLVLPVTSDSVDQALAKGGSATIVRRWSKDQYLAKVAEAEIEGSATDANGEVATMTEDSLTGLQDLPKKLARMVGIRASRPHVVMFETWLLLPMGAKGFDKDGDKRLCRLWWNLNREPEGLRRNPYWNDRCPLLSHAVEKMSGLFKGPSQIEKLAPIQYEANDAANERADVDHYSAMPIIRRTPGQGNAPLILNIAAIWEAGQGEVEFLQFPDLSQRSRARILDAIQIIFQSLGVNPAMLPQQTGRPGAARRNQAEVALEQQVDLLTVAEMVVVPDDHILSPAAEWTVDLDYQFRDRELTIRAFGEMGVDAKMINVPPLQNRRHYTFRWCGAQQAKQNVAMMQAGTAFINTMRGLAQELGQEGYKLRLGPVIERLSSNIFGAELGAMTVLDLRHQMSVDPQLENTLLSEGHLVPAHPFDNHQQHLQSHSEDKAQTGDPHGTKAVHIQDHLMMMAAQSRAQLMQMAGGQGAPGGGGRPGVSGRPAGAPPPQPGAQPQRQRPMRGPPGMIPPEQLPRSGALIPPRKF